MENSFFLNLISLIIAFSMLKVRKQHRCPFFVTILARFILKNPIRSWQITALDIAMTGSAFIIEPGFDFTSSIPALRSHVIPLPPR